MGKTLVSVFAAAFAVSMLSFAATASAEGGCGSIESQSVSIPDPVTTADTETTTPIVTESPTSG